MLSIKYRGLDAENEASCGHILGAILSIGFFNRPTFLIFAFYPIFWSISGSKNMNRAFYCFAKLARLLPMFMVASTLLIIMDTLYFAKMDLFSIPFTSYYTIFMDNKIVTPLNFIMFNHQTANLELCGLHPRYSHFVANIPILFTILCIPFYRDTFLFFRSFVRSPLNKLHRNSVKKMMMMTTLIGIAGLSIFPRQETRFILPLLVPFSYMYRHLVKQKLLMILWLIINASFILFFGFINEAGLTQSMFHLHQIIRTNQSDHQPTHILFTAVQLQPLHLLNVKNSKRNIRIYDYSNSFEGFESHLEIIQKSSAALTLYLIAPSCFDDDLIEVFNTNRRLNRKQEISWLESFFPHVPIELLPYSMEALSQDGWKKAFSLNIWKIVYK